MLSRHRVVDRFIDRMEDRLRLIDELLSNGDVAGALRIISTLSQAVEAAFEHGPRGRGPFVRDDDDGLTVTLGGSADAVGEHTRVHGEVDLTVTADEDVTIALGHANFSAAAADSGGRPFASADAFVDFSGADFVFVYEVFADTDQDPGATFQAAGASLSVIAIDFADFDLRAGPYVHEVFRDRTGRLSEDDPGLSGNLASAEFSAEAFGTNSAAFVDANVLAIEDHLSSVAINAFAGINAF